MHKGLSDALCSSASTLGPQEPSVQGARFPSARRASARRTGGPCPELPGIFATRPNAPGGFVRELPLFPTRSSNLPGRAEAREQEPPVGRALCSAPEEGTPRGAEAGAAASATRGAQGAGGETGRGRPVSPKGEEAGDRKRQGTPGRGTSQGGGNKGATQQASARPGHPFTASSPCQIQVVTDTGSKFHLLLDTLCTELGGESSIMGPLSHCSGPFPPAQGWSNLIMISLRPCTHQRGL